MADQGGYDVEVTEHDNDRFNCGICFLVIKGATNGCDCHVFCRSCLIEYKHKTRFDDNIPICPAGCGNKIDPIKLLPNQTIDLLINKLKTKCSNQDCLWTGDLLDLVKDHKARCIYATVKCDRIRCTDVFVKRDKEKHEELCLQKCLRCTYCQENVIRINKINHEESCALERVNCPFRKAGCDTLICRKDVEKHEKDLQLFHMKLQMKFSEKVNTSNEKLKLSNDVLNQIVNQLKERNENLHQKIDEMGELFNGEIDLLKKSNDALQQNVNQLKESQVVQSTNSKYLEDIEEFKKLSDDDSIYKCLKMQESNR